MWDLGEAQRGASSFLRGSVQLGCWWSKEARMSQEKMERWGEEQGAGGEREEGREK